MKPCCAVMTTPPPRPLIRWLFLCCLMIAAMVVIGGVTRLTESGLSIVEWQPLSGTLPPLSDADWGAAFTAYKASPQYRQVNAGMSLAEFKTIFWWEYIHRLWGRLIGLVYALPLLWFWLRGRIPDGYKAPLLGLLALGAVQGAVGWWMVASGLKDVPWVSPYRLATHLGLALIILLGCLTLALRLGDPRPFQGRRWGYAVPGLVFVTILSGALVAGLRAGLIHNSFPDMSGQWIADDYRNPALSWLANAFETHAAVQFHHRVLALVTLAVVLTVAWIWGRRARDGGERRLALAMGGMVCVQVALGIATLLAHVPVPLAAAHQLGAVLLLGFAWSLAWRRGRG